MQISFNKQTALAMLRSARANEPQRIATLRRCDVATPDPSPRTRWSKTLFSSLDAGLPLDLSNLSSIEVAVPNRAQRLGTVGVANTTYSRNLPNGSFVNLGNGISISSPELLFVELASSLNPIEHLMLGHELCGTFSRDAVDPYDGEITYGVKPVTNTKRIETFIESAGYIRGIDEARKSVKYLNDNAWSPTESLVAALLRLPSDNLGLDVGELVLNPREHAKYNLPGAKGSRVPDILIKGTPVGVNYDGLVHLDLNSIVSATMHMAQHPELSQAQAALDSALSDVREKVLDDIRRNRELAADGLFVFPLVKEDLYARGGFEAIAEQLLDAIEKYTERNMSAQRQTLRNEALSAERRRAILSLLPGRSERSIKVGRFIEGRQIVEAPCEVQECWVEF